MSLLLEFARFIISGEAVLIAVSVVGLLAAFAWGKFMDKLHSEIMKKEERRDD